MPIASHADKNIDGQTLPLIENTLPFTQPSAVALVETAGRRYLLGVPYASAGCNLLVIVALPDDGVRTSPLDDAGGVVVAGADGYGYLATTSGRLWRIDPRDGQREALDWPLTGTAICCGLSHPAGKLYFGAADGRIAEFDPYHAMVTRWLGDHQGTVDALVVLADGDLVAAVRAEATTLLRFTPETGVTTRLTLPTDISEQVIAQAIEFGDELLVCLRTDSSLLRLSLQPPHSVTALPALPDGGRAACLRQVGGIVLASGALSGSLYRWTGTEWDTLGVPMPYDPLLFTVTADANLVGMTYHGRLVQSADWCHYTLSPASARCVGGMAIQAVCVGPDRQVYYAACGSTRLGRWDPESGRAVELPVVAPYPGEVRALGVAAERLYLGFGNPCGVMRYYPDLPYRLLENPLLVGMTGTDQHCPSSGMVSLHGELFFLSAAARATDCDALIRINPADDQLTTYRHLFHDQRLTSLATDRGNGLLVIGGRSRQGAAEIVCWSPDTASITARVTPFPDARLVTVWIAENGRVYVSDGGERLAVVSTATGEVLDNGVFPLGTITALITTVEGELYGLAGGWLFRYDPACSAIEPLVEAAGTCLTAVRRGLFVYARGEQLFSARTR